MLTLPQELIRTFLMAPFHQVMQLKYLRMLCISLLALLSGMSSCSNEQDTGFARYTVDADGTEFEVFAYHPPVCNETDILVVFHGFKRKAEQLRNNAVPIAKLHCLSIFAPLFDMNRFPNWRYHRAGVLRFGELQPRENWTGPILHALLDRLRELSGENTNRLYLFGHSAGAQFLSRISAYTPPKSVTGIVIANPSMHVLPVMNADAPVGFSGLFSEPEARQRLKAYLALPIRIYLGKMDTADKYLVKSKEAMLLGETRLERGRSVFRFAEQVAQDKGWKFNWKLIEAPNVGHSSSGMLRAPELSVALGFLTDLEEITLSYDVESVSDQITVNIFHH